MSWKNVQDVLQFLKQTQDFIKTQDPQLIARALKTLPKRKKFVAKSILAPHTIQFKKTKTLKPVQKKKRPTERKRRRKDRVLITFYDVNNIPLGTKVLRKRNFKKYDFRDAPKQAMSYSIALKK